MVLAWSDDPHKFVDSALDLTDVATYLGEKYGGWYPLAERMGTSDGRWIAMPMGASGGRVCYRQSMITRSASTPFPRTWTASST